MNAINPSPVPNSDSLDRGTRFAVSRDLNPATCSSPKTMKTNPGLARRSALLAALLVPCALIQAQTTAAPTPASAPAEEDVITLTPFEVSAGSAEEGYSATTTLAGNRLKTDLRDIGSAV